jgi:DNA-binding transcriptional LysR family regulator
MTLTENRRVALERARSNLADGVAVEAELSAKAELPSGLVRMTAPMSFGIQQLGPLLSEFLETYPDVSLDLNLTDAHEDLIANGYDLALRIAALADSSLRARKLCDVRRPIVAAPCYLQRYGRPAHPRDLQMHKTILHSNVPNADVWRLQHPTHGEWEGRLRSRLITNNADVVVPTLVAGRAIAVQPIFSVWRELEQGSLEEILPGWSLAPVSLYLVTPPSALRPSRVKVLLDYLVEKLAT